MVIDTLTDAGVAPEEDEAVIQLDPQVVVNVETVIGTAAPPGATT